MGAYIEIQPNPDKPFLYLGDEAYSFAEIERLTAGAAARLQAQAGLRRGERVALLMPNGLPYALAALALLRLGVVAVPLNTRLTAAELNWQLQNVQCRLLLAQGEFSESARQLTVPALDMLPLPPAASAAAAGFGRLALAEDCAILHTSGTTGKPKAAVLTAGNIYHSAQASAQRLGAAAGDRWLCAMPLFHIGGLSVLLRSLLYGTALDLMRFDIDAVNNALSDKPITLVSLTPTMLARLLAARQRRWNRQLRLILLGGEAPSERLLARCAAEKLPIAVSYGLTEAASQVATATGALVRQKPGCVGKPLPGTQVRIRAADGGEAPPGCPGEVLVSGPTVMRGYFGDRAATAAALRQGWLHTGDIGRIDQDGDLHILQRRADLIVSGGENIYPAEVEAALRRHPAVKEALVFAMPDERWGQRPAALIKCRAGAALSAAALCDFARERLAGYKIPRQIAFVAALPRGVSGKLKRADARKALEDALSRP